LSTNVEPLHLLRTKLYRPRLVGDVVHRGRIYELLDRYLDRPATLVCAPAGFGKTTLLSDWLEHCTHLSAWVALDDGDNYLGVFLGYFVAAIRTLFPAACRETFALLHAPVAPPLNRLVTALVNDLDCLADNPALPAGQRFVLVLDDYHRVSEPAVHNLLTGLLRHPPRSLHLVISARQDPPFPVHALRARGELGEIRARELRFTAEEVGTFVQQSLGRALAGEAVSALTERTEGWATGLRLAALTIDTGADIAGPALVADDRFVLEYLLNEVLARVPVATQDFLLKTSILDRICGSLCDALVAPAGPDWGGGPYLAWLAEQNLFTFSLDVEGTWYRYHQLFRKLLESRLEREYGPEEIAQLHARAGAWFARHGLVEEAIRHALAASDESEAVRLVEEHRHAEMNREHWHRLGHWLSLMPRELIDARPQLLLLQAWIMQRQWRYADLLPLLERIEALLERKPPAQPELLQLSAEVDVLRSMLYFYTLDRERSLACAERALKTAPLTCSIVRGYAWMYCAGARQAKGDGRGAVSTLAEALKEDGLHGNAFPMHPYRGLCTVHWMNADLANLALAADRMLQVAQERDLSEGVGWGHYYLGCALYQQNDLDGAEREFAAVVRQRYVAHGMAFSHGAFGLASVLSARGRDAEARELADSVTAYALEVGNGRIASEAEAFRAWLALRRGAVAEAQRLLTSSDPNLPMAPMTTFQVAPLTRAGVLVGVGAPAGLEEAAGILACLHERTAVTHNTRFLIEVLALQAVLEDARGNSPEALKSLEQAVALAEAGGVVRVFVDLGARMSVLLRRLPTRAAHSRYIDIILSAYGEESVRLQPAVPERANGAHMEPPAESGVVEQWRSHGASGGIWRG
jgi:LuxR family maltose regulon positive regulatory protein